MEVWPPPLCGALPALLALQALLVVKPTHSLPTSSTALAALRQQPRETLTEASVYLTSFGWMDPLSDRSKSGSLVSLSETISEFQKFAGLKVTGVLDNATLSKMHQPRCGVPDRQVPVQPSRRSKRYALQGSAWSKKSLTYKIENWLDTRSRDDVRIAMEDAFKAWSDVSALTFQASTARADIDIRFEAGDHGDGDPFDGPGGTLAHAFFPMYGGDAHFDKSENWRASPNGGGSIDLFTVATHEFGHSLGLSHSSVDTALMAPFYRPPSADRNIVKQDDINGIQKLYGPPTNQVSPPNNGGGEGEGEAEGEAEEEEEEDSVLCTDSSVDAMLTLNYDGRSRTYAFKGADYWRLTDLGVEKGYPKKISEKWGGAPDNLDAALAYTPKSSTRDTLFFFKGNQVWRMTNVPTVDDGYPKAISDEFEGIPNDIDAAFTRKRNRKRIMYFFKGNQYWRFDYEAAKASEQALTGPKSMRIWRGVPKNIDTVMMWKNGKTYFFEGSNYYRFDYRRRRVSRRPRYPRNTGVYWFGCSGHTSGILAEQSHRRGDIAAEDSYRDTVVGFGDGDTRPRRSAAAGLLPSPLLLLLLMMMMGLPLVPAVLRV